MTRIGWATAGLVLLAAVGTASAQTPANEGVCDILAGGTPGLYGLCVAFCEAHDCVPDFSAGDPWADCKPSDPKLLQIYNRLKDPGDPEMPCIVTETDCPCFTQEMVDEIPTPYSQCIIDYSFITPPGEDRNTNIIYEQGTGAQATLTPYGDSCSYGNALVEPPIFLFFTTNRAQAEECKQFLVNTIEANTDQCELLCDPVCNN